MTGVQTCALPIWLSNKSLFTYAHSLLHFVRWWESVHHTGEISVADLTESTLFDYLRFQSSRQPPPSATTINDRNETNAIKRVFGKHAYKLAVSSTKSMHGHPLGAGGGIEAVACVKAMQDNWVPPTIGLDEADADCDLDYVPNQGRAKDVTYAMSNSFAFGGLNAVLIFGPPPA